MDQDLNDDMNKLVRYSIVCVDRENETVLQSVRETLVKDRMDGMSFTAWKISEFRDQMSEGRVNLPEEWENDPPPQIDKKTPKLTKLPPELAKYLRVSYQVIDRWPRERFKYEEKEIRVLHDIKGAIDNIKGGGGIPGLSDLKPGQQLQVETK